MTLVIKYLYYIKNSCMYILLFLVGILLGIFNSLAIKWTIEKFVKYKQTSLIVISLFFRMLIICSVFLIFMGGKWKNAVIMLLGLTISKIFFILRERKDVKK